MRVPLRFLAILGLLILAPLLAACDGDQQAEAPDQPGLLVYTGITMVKPIKEIAGLFTEREGIRVTITQGGSEDLYQALKASKVGDLYLPGSASYREKHLAEGLLGAAVHVGYNQAAIIVADGNPKRIKDDLASLLRPDLATVIGDPETGSIGRETRRILSQAGIYDAVFRKALYLTTDSRDLNNAIRSGEADVVLNWRATGFFPENIDSLDVIDLAPEIATPKKLVLNRLTFSKQAEAAQAFMDLAASEEGQAIFRRHGFLDKELKADGTG